MEASWILIMRLQSHKKILSDCVKSGFFLSFYISAWSEKKETKLKKENTPPRQKIKTKNPNQPTNQKTQPNKKAPNKQKPNQQNPPLFVQCGRKVFLSKFHNEGGETHT